MPDLCPGCGSDLTRDVCWCDHDDQPEPTIRHQNPTRAPQEARRATQTPPMDPDDLRTFLDAYRASRGLVRGGTDD